MNGDFPCKQYPRTKPGFHESDVRDFILTVVAGAQQVIHGTEGVITFRTAMHRLMRDSSWQLHFVGAVLNKKIAIEAQSGNNLATLLIAENEYSGYIEGFISPMSGATLDYEKAEGTVSPLRREHRALLGPNKASRGKRFSRRSQSLRVIA